MTVCSNTAATCPPPLAALRNYRRWPGPRGKAVAGRGTTGTSRPWPQAERHESPGLPAEELIFARIDADGFGDRSRFQQALDEEPGREDLLAGGFQRCQPVPHLPAPAPGLLNGPDLEIAAAVAQPADPVAQVVHPEVALPDAGLADLHHARALVKPGHPGTTADEFGGVQAGAARRVEDPL